MGRPLQAVSAQADCYTVKEFCTRNRIGLSTYYRMRREGRGPGEIRLGGKVLITIESAARWRRDRDCEALGLPSDPAD